MKRAVPLSRPSLPFLALAVGLSAAVCAYLLAWAPIAGAEPASAAVTAEADGMQAPGATAETPEPARVDGAGVATAGPWPGWRGPNRDAKVDGEPWPADLKGLQKVWAVDQLGPSYSGPIVAEDRIFTTETREKKYEVVSAFDRDTGELLWTRQWEGAMKVPFFAAKNGSWIRSTPVYDGETLFVGGIREVLVALDGETGAQKWSLDFPATHKHDNPPFGFVCSPLIVGDHLYVEAAGAFFKLDKTDGSVVWKTTPFSDGEMTSEGTFSSPILATVAGREQLLVQTRLELVGVAPEDGEILWRQPVPSFRGMNILTPLVYNDTVFTSTYRNASYLFQVEAAESGKLGVRELWQNTAQAYMSSPVEIDGVAYMHLGNGRLTAVDLNGGERLWTTEPFGSYWSMVTQNDRILALDSDGDLVLTRVARSGYEVEDQRKVADRSTWAHLAVADDQLVIRDLEGLTVWRWSAAATQEPAAQETVAAVSP